jgi:predicted GIY-YIG superfamily endonuclease
MCVMGEVGSDVPGSPGVYFLLGSGRRLLYVGKATNLRKRLQQHARDDRWRHVRDVRWELTSSVDTALAREADILAAVRPPWNKAHVDSYFAFITVSPRRLTLGPDGDYGCFPHLSKGALTSSGRACIDGFDALNRIVQVTHPDRGALHAFLTGQSSGLLVLPLHIDQPHVRHGIERDRKLAAQFCEHGPRAMRTIRLRHGGRGNVTREQFADWITQEVAELLNAGRRRYTGSTSGSVRGP